MAAKLPLLQLSFLSLPSDGKQWPSKAKLALQQVVYVLRRCKHSYSASLMQAD